MKTFPWIKLRGYEAMKAWEKFAKHRRNAFTVHVDDAGPTGSYIGILGELVGNRKEWHEVWFSCWYFAQTENGYGDNRPAYFMLHPSDLDSLEAAVKGMRAYTRKRTKA